MARRIFIITLLFSLALQMGARVRLHHMIGSGMVLQQQTEARLWGWDEPGKKVKVHPSWERTVYSTRANDKGLWTVVVKTPKASFEPWSITFDDGERTKVDNVLIGEVWICAGQSNMKMPVKGYQGGPVGNYNETMTEAVSDRHIRYIEMPRLMSATPLEDTGGRWKEIGPETVGDCSAVGYFFARVVSRVLNIPVGLIAANQGGTRVEAWMNKETLERYTGESTDSVSIVQQNARNGGRRQMLWYNGTFHPIVRYTVKGILYYQGESNVGDPGNQYSERLSLLVSQWRREFGLGDIPFYQVEIAPFAYKGKDDGMECALLREQQYRSLSMIPNSALIGTNDLVSSWERSQIHPCQKKQVGERLAYTALNRDYGMKQYIWQSPNYKSMTVKGNSCIVEIDTHSGGMERWLDIEGFEVAGADRVFHPARATWKRGNSTVVVTSDEVSEPVAVRYCFRNFKKGNFRNLGLLPLVPFRTDEW